MWFRVEFRIRQSFALDYGNYSEGIGLENPLIWSRITTDSRLGFTLNSDTKLKSLMVQMLIKVNLPDEPTYNCGATSFLSARITDLSTFPFTVLASKFYLFTDKLQCTGSVSISEAYRRSGTLCKLTLLLDPRPSLLTVFEPQPNFIKRLVMGRMSDIKSFLGRDTTIAFH